MPRKESGEIAKVVTTAEISEILGVSKRRIQQFADDGALVRLSRGYYDLPQSINKFIEYQISKALPSDSKIDKEEEMALWTRAKKEKTQLEVQIIKGELHRSEDVKRIMNDMLIAFRQKTLSLPSKMAPQLIMVEDLQVIKDLLKNSVIELLTELKDYDPSVFYEISKDKMFLNGEDEDEDDEMSDHRVNQLRL
ncbi:type IV toxin-antitoxin system AbiEi family antitoxin domain-containing protein [Niallia circulans]|uniref:type IV toxin-antitoxin system AbiEi family antitoxin domain-containing protein n=1 Tax=Niallia circulans TaxID=1397 RepID=UPI001639C9D5|nr:type IV toxin-antitoxin system AbiEi family antitoxin domain-containing protein [Niallia circulans]